MTLTAMALSCMPNAARSRTMHWNSAGAPTAVGMARMTAWRRQRLGIALLLASQPRSVQRDRNLVLHVFLHALSPQCLHHPTRGGLSVPKSALPNSTSSSSSSSGVGGTWSTSRGGRPLLIQSCALLLVRWPLTLNGNASRARFPVRGLLLDHLRRGRGG